MGRRAYLKRLRGVARNPRIYGVMRTSRYEVILCKRCNINISGVHIEKHAIRLHPNMTKTKCLWCRKEFFYLHTLRVHVKAKHQVDDEEKASDCPICHYIVEPALFVDHMKEFHPDHSGKFQCAVCFESGRPSRQFATKRGVIKHMRVTTGHLDQATKAVPTTAQGRHDVPRDERREDNVTSPNERPSDVASPNELPPDVASPNELPPDVASPNELPPDVASPNELPPDVASPNELPPEIPMVTIHAPVTSPRSVVHTHNNSNKDSPTVVVSEDLPAVKLEVVFERIAPERIDSVIVIVDSDDSCSRAEGSPTQDIVRIFSPVPTIVQGSKGDDGGEADDEEDEPHKRVPNNAGSGGGRRRMKWLKRSPRKRAAPPTPTTAASAADKFPPTNHQRSLEKQITGESFIKPNSIVAAANAEPAVSNNTLGTSLNFAARYLHRQAGFNCTRLDRRLVHSNFSVSKTLRVADHLFNCCDFSPCAGYLSVGTQSGEVKVFNLRDGNEEFYINCYQSSVASVRCSREGELLITSSSCQPPLSAVWSVMNKQPPSLLMVEKYAEFGNMAQDRILGTNNEVATIYDLQIGGKVLSLVPSSSNQYNKNRATFSPTDELVLSDGVLWDVRSAREIHTFPKLNQNFSGVFHPNGLEVVSNQEVWDLRTFHLLRTVTSLDQCQVKFSPQNVIYAISMKAENDMDMEHNSYESSFKTLDSFDYTSISTTDVRREISDLCVNTFGSQIAIVENQGGGEYDSPQESVVRVYNVGRSRNRNTEDEMEEVSDTDSGEWLLGKGSFSSTDNDDNEQPDHHKRNGGGGGGGGGGDANKNSASGEEGAAESNSSSPDTVQPIETDSDATPGVDPPAKWTPTQEADKIGETPQKDPLGSEASDWNDSDDVPLCGIRKRMRPTRKRSHAQILRQQTAQLGLCEIREPRRRAAPPPPNKRRREYKGPPRPETPTKYKWRPVFKNKKLENKYRFKTPTKQREWRDLQESRRAGAKYECSCRHKFSSWESYVAHCRKSSHPDQHWVHKCQITRPHFHKRMTIVFTSKTDHGGEKNESGNSSTSSDTSSDADWAATHEKNNNLQHSHTPTSTPSTTPTPHLHSNIGTAASSPDQQSARNTLSKRRSTTP